MIGEVEEEGKEEERTKCGARKGQKLVKNTKEKGEKVEGRGRKRNKKREAKKYKEEK